MKPQIRLTKQNREALLKAAIVFVGNCSHPHNNRLSMSTRTTSGKQVCTLCQQVRYQDGVNGPWKAWGIQT